MTTLQDIMGLITKRKIKTPSDNDYIISAAYTDTQERLKPQPKMEANLLSIGAIKKYIQASVGTTPTLQQVLDNNHELGNGNNFQGTGAGLDNTGIDVNAFGNNACDTNIGNVINALGSSSAFSNEGNNVNALGQSAAFINSGNDVNGLGFQASYLNEGDNVNGFGHYAALSNSGNNVNALGFNAGVDEYGNGNTLNNVNLFGENAEADEDGQTVLSKDGTIMARISTTDLTATRKYNLPDADGTIALTTYKVYTALLTQSGADNPGILSNSNLTIGVTYQIKTGSSGSYDFTNVGAPNNDIGTYFVATGTTPNDWASAFLNYNTAAPVVTVLENTIGNIWFQYSEPGLYLCSSLSLFTPNKTIIDMDAYCQDGNPECNLVYQGLGDSGFKIGTYKDGYNNSRLSNHRLEIRVYN